MAASDLEFTVRRRQLVIEEINHEGGPVAGTPLLRGAAMALVSNPFAGRYEPDIAPGMDLLEPLGEYLADRLVTALGGVDRIESYGKGAIVGGGGEVEHGALWHVPGGWAMRRALGEALAIVPSAKKVGGPGTRIDIPLSHKDASYVRSHFDAIEVRCPSGPAEDEILFILAMATGPRVHARVGGLRADQITERDGLR